MNDVAVPANVLSLCSGGGGLDLGLRLAVPSARTVCYVENEVTACGVLATHMADGGLDDAPIWTDLRTFDGAAWRGTVDTVIGGYPCQPFSNAGKRLGADDPRHLWPHVARIVAAVEPRWCFFENVGAHLRLGGHEVIRELQGLGYRTAATLLTAEEVGAPHGRERLFILAHRTGELQREPDDEGRAEPRRDTRGDAGGNSGRLADSYLDGRESKRSAGLLVAGASRRHDADGSSAAQLADSERSSGSAEPREQHQERAEVATRAGCSSSRAVLDVEDADSERGRGGATGREHAADAQAADRGVGDWPPGPTDDAGWRRVLAVRPDLAPATEPGVRDLVDGVALGLARSDQLHILGNGVVPQQAAYALTLLMDALGVEGRGGLNG